MNKLVIAVSVFLLSSVAFAESMSHTEIQVSEDLPSCSVGRTFKQSCGHDNRGQLRTFNDPGCSVSCYLGQTPVCNYPQCVNAYQFTNSQCYCADNNN